MNQFLKPAAFALAAATSAMSASPASAAVTVTGQLSNSGTSDIFFDWKGGDFSVQVDGASRNGIADPEIFLFRNNGSASGALTGALLANADDILWPILLSARISGTLSQGSYVLSVGTFNFTQAEARAGKADFVASQRGYVATFSNGTTISAAVPEPATWAMMLVGFGGIGFAMRRRKAKVSTHVRFA